MSNPLVSVIMPAYNAEKYIGESIQSVIDQTWLDWELIIVDDGSVDHTAEIIREFQAVNNRIKYIYQTNSGPGNAKNTAIKHSNGDYIAFLDSDDLWLKEKLQISMQEFQGENLSLVFTDSFVFKQNAKSSLPLITMGVTDGIYRGRDSILTFLYSNLIPNLTVVIKRKDLLEAGQFLDRQVAEDYDMWLRLLKNGCIFKAVSTPLSMHRIHDESLTAKDRHGTLQVIEIIKNFGNNNPDYKKTTLKISRDKIKYWLYYGSDRTNRKFRILMRGLYEFPIAILFYILSFIVPIDHLRKIIIRLV